MLSRKHGSKYAAAVSAGAFAGVLMFGTPASAHYVIAYHGSDQGSVSTDHRTVAAYDRECDNHGVYVNYTTTAGHAYVVSDDDGCSNNQHSEYTQDGFPVSFFRVCERSVGCSEHKYA